MLKKDKCLRCHKEWYRRKPERPITCPGCRSPYWDKERKKEGKNRIKNI